MIIRANLERKREKNELESMSPRRRKRMDADLKPTFLLKREMISAKIAFLSHPSFEKLSRTAVGKMVKNTVKISKEEEGFDRAVILRDRTLTYRKRSLKRVVLQNDAIIDLLKKDDKGRTNLKRMHLGYAPWGPDDKPINLHHLAQDDRHPLAEITMDGHLRWGAIQTHYRYGFPEFNRKKGTPKQVNRAAFNKFRQDYWKLRSLQFGNSRLKRQTKITEFFKDITPTSSNFDKQPKITYFFNRLIDPIK